ncbi:MAG: hypothetical protein WA036_05830 [Streptococcus suis]
MKTILRYFWYREKYALHRSVNGFFYYLRKLPLVGKSIPESISSLIVLSLVSFWSCSSYPSPVAS